MIPERPLLPEKSRPTRAPLRAGLALSAALAWCAVTAGQARGAVVLQSFRQGATATASELNSSIATVTQGSNRLLLLAVSMARNNISVTSMSWRGYPAIRVATAMATACRTEIWQLLEPPTGSGPLQISLSAATSVGVGILVFTGVDQQQPTSVGSTASGWGGSPTLSTPVPDNRPVIASACLGGLWSRTVGGPKTTASGEASLWDFIEAGVVAAGVQRVATNGMVTARWDVQSGVLPYTWSVLSVSVTPAGAALPDAGVDVQPIPDADADTRPDTAASPDVAPPPPPDASPGQPMPPPDASPPVDASAPADSLAPDTAHAPDLGGPRDLPDASSDPGELPGPTVEGPGPGTVREIQLEVGCNCQAVGRGSGSPTSILSLLVGLGSWCLFRARNRPPAPKR